MADDILAVFGRQVLHRRLGHGLTQRQLAEAVDVTRSSIANIEAGRQSPGVLLVAALADALNTTPGNLLSPLGSAEDKPEYAAEQIAKAAAVAARLYVLAALDEAELRVHDQVTTAFRAVRARYADDLRGDTPWKLLVAAGQMYRAELGAGTSGVTE